MQLFQIENKIYCTQAAPPLFYWSYDRAHYIVHLHNHKFMYNRLIYAYSFSGLKTRRGGRRQLYFSFPCHINSTERLNGRTAIGWVTMCTDFRFIFLAGSYIRRDNSDRSAAAEDDSHSNGASWIETEGEADLRASRFANVTSIITRRSGKWCVVF
jgi:hypothetical protein